MKKLLLFFIAMFLGILIYAQTALNFSPNVFGKYKETVTVTGINVNGNTTISTEAWCLLNQYNTVMNVILIKETPSTACSMSNVAYILFFDNSNASNQGLATFGFGDGTNFNSVSSTVSVPLGEWHHIAGTYDGSTLKVYVDGIEQGSTSVTASLHDENIEMNIGNRWNCVRRYYDGNIDEVRIWDDTRTQQEIRDNMHRELLNPIAETDLIAYYPLNEGTGTTAYDEGPNSYNGQLGGYTFGGNGTTAPSWVTSTAPMPYYTIADGNWNADAIWATGQKAPVNAWSRVRIDNFVSITTTESCEEIHVSSGASLLGNDNLTAASAIVDIDYSGNQWHMISSPVSNAITGMFTGLYLMTHNETSNDYSYISSTTSPLNVMQGYSLWNQFGDSTASFQGTMNDGVLSKNLTRTLSGDTSGWNLVGNPYPSSIDWNATSGWTKTNVGGTIYCYDGSGSGNWTTWNGTTGTNGGTRYIAPGQGFFVSVNNDGSTSGALGMTNDVRVNNNTTFFKDEPTDIVKVKVSGNSFSDETVIYFREEATTGFDDQMDAHKLFSFETSTPNIYSTANNGMAINVLPEVTPVPINVKVGTETGIYNIEITSYGDFEDLYLEDIATGTITNINKYSYSFDYIPGVENRFVLHFNPVGIDDYINETFNIYSYNKDVFVSAPINTIGTIIIYDLIGKEVASSNINSLINKITIEKGGYYIVQVVGNKNLITKKVFIP